jgi:N4-gp56 family major capsid protein
MANPTIYGNGTTTASNGANTIVHYYDRAGIKAANAVNVYGQFCDKKSQPTRMGKTFKISKWQHIYDLDQENVDFNAKGYLGKRDLATVTTNLANSGTAGTVAEGAGAVNKVTPKKVTVEASIARYGFMIEYTDEVVLFSEDPVQVKYREELGYLVNQAQEDLIQKDMLEGAGIVLNAQGVATAELGSTITADDTNADLYKVSFDLVRKGVKALVRNRAQRNTEIVTGSTKIDTKPINKAFYAIVGPEVKYDLETITRGSSYETEWAYVPAYRYAAASNLAEGEIGSMHDVRFIESEGAMMEAGAGAVVPQNYAGALSASGGTDNSSAAEGDRDNFDVFPILFPTKGAFATLGLRGKGKVTFHSKAPSDVYLDNPYGTKGFFSANMWYAGLVLQPEKLLRINVLATA